MGADRRIKKVGGWGKEKEVRKGADKDMPQGSKSVWRGEMERLRLEPGKLRQRCCLLDFISNTREMSFKMTFIDSIFNMSLETFFTPGRILISKAYSNLSCFIFVFSLKFLFCGYSIMGSAVLFLQLFQHDGEERPASIDQGQKNQFRPLWGGSICRN